MLGHQRVNIQNNQVNPSACIADTNTAYLHSQLCHGDVDSTTFRVERMLANRTAKMATIIKANLIFAILQAVPQKRNGRFVLAYAGGNA